MFIWLRVGHDPLFLGGKHPGRVQFGCQPLGQGGIVMHCLDCDHGQVQQPVDHLHLGQTLRLGHRAESGQVVDGGNALGLQLGNGARLAGLAFGNILRGLFAHQILQNKNARPWPRVS